MKTTLKPGLSHRATIAVTDDLLVPRVSPRLAAFADMPPVFATAFVVAFVEATCIELLRPHLDVGEHSVGVHVDLSHTAPTPPGLSVHAEVELLSLEGRILTFTVTVQDDAGPISSGRHQRALIDLNRFNSKATLRAQL